MRTILIEVTTADIEAGVPQESASCPVALAIARVLGEPVEVGYHGVTSNGPWHAQWTFARAGRTSVPLPYDVATRIENFDGGDTMKPFTFEIEVR